MDMFIEIDDLPPGAIGFVASGRITADERLSVLEASFREAVARGERVRLLYVAGPDFEGYDRGGLYDDAVFGSRHFRDFERIAFVADDGPYNRAVHAMEGLIPAELRVFAPAEMPVARAWLARETT
jgi:hypothetical protein